MPFLPPSMPCGRSELLGWINQLCNADYPTVESLRDGAAYCTIIEAALSRLAKNSTSVQSQDWRGTAERADKAKVFLAKVDWTATTHVYECTDPSLDTALIREVCLKNMWILQSMLRNCLPSDCLMDVNPERLATGKLQEHMAFLTWLGSFVKRLLTRYSKAELSKKKAVSAAPKVEGVKLNRAMILLEEKRQGRPGGNRTSSSLPGRSSSLSVIESSQRMSSRTSSCPPVQKRESSEAPQQKVLKETSNTNKVPITTRDHTPRERMETIGIPENFSEALVSARAEVEELEAVVLREHNAYQKWITDPTNAPNTMERIVSLESLGKLLEERDSLAHSYGEIDEIIRNRVLQGASTPLLMHICSILYPPQNQ